ncbi:MAG TPA: DNA-binding protein [Candidatus Riflebacteria bacterium]|nr:DNA-binding protein [Candidatus Riflebacteria bacterium]
MTKLMQIDHEHLEQKIYQVRGQKVMLDSDLAGLYGVENRRLNEQVTRNIERFPEDFMFQLTIDEAKNVMSQFATLPTVGHFRHPPRVFTEHGILMLSSILRSQQAVQVNIEIMRAFVKMRAVTAIHGELSSRLTELEKTVKTQGGSINFILDLIDKELKKKQIGFKPAKKHDDN